jgi:ABC-2 type transport system ATP-binding protein
VVRSPEAARLRGLLDRAGATVTADAPDGLRVDGLTAEEIGTIACHARVPVFELRVVQASLEDAFMQATQDSVEFATTGQEIAR